MGYRGVVLFVMLAFAAIHCGENVANPNTGAYPPPGNLKAFSADRSTVQLQWTAPSGVTDTLFKDYLLVWAGGGKEESIAKTLLTVAVDSLSPGAQSFTLFSRDINNVIGPGASITWAPAERFPGLYEIQEMRLPSPTNAAIDCGTDGGSPTTMALDNTATTADFYLYGGGGQVPVSPMVLYSADQAGYGLFKVTRFSTIAHASATLNYFLSSFPSEGTFTEATMPISENYIYYAQLSDQNGAKHYARILVFAIQGGFPTRSVSLRISLQRSLGVPFAHAVEQVAERQLALATLRPMLP